MPLSQQGELGELRNCSGTHYQFCVSMPLSQQGELGVKVLHLLAKLQKVSMPLSQQGELGVYESKH